MFKLIELLMLYTGLESVGRVIQTIIYVFLMLGVIFFSVLICSIMK